LTMGRKIITILLIAIAFWGLRKLWRGRMSADRRTQPTFEKTVQCAHCGVHVSTQLAIERDGRHYCCPEHLPQ